MDGDRMEHALYRRSAHLALGQRVVAHPLHHLERVPVRTAVFV